MALYGLIYGYKYTADAIPDLSGKVAVVTGASAGIGEESAKELARHGAKVYVGARSEERAKASIARIEKAVPAAKGKLQFLHVDLCDLEGVRRAAKELSDKEQKIDILLNNAGVMAEPYKLTKDGVETQFQTNHLGPFLFTNLLLPKIEASSDPRVVNTSSLGHQFAAADCDFSSLEIVNKDFGSTWKRYGNSKLANILFANELGKKHPKILANSCHPGNVYTELTRGPTASYGIVSYPLTHILQPVMAYAGIMLHAPAGALTQLYLSTSEEVSKNKITGRYYVPIAIEKQPTKAVNDANAKRLWDTSEKILSDKGFSLKL